MFADPKLCLHCGYQGTPKRIMKGSIGMEIVLWLCFLAPGLIYSIWRHTSVYDGCRSCGAGDMIPLDSPRANQMRAQGGIPPLDANTTRRRMGPGAAIAIGFVGMLVVFWLIGAAMDNLASARAGQASVQTSAPAKSPTAPAKQATKKTRR